MLSQQEHERVASQLSQYRDVICTNWEKQIRKQVSSTSGKSSAFLKDSLPEYLDDLANLLMSEKPSNWRDVELLGKSHGRQRATHPDYSVSQVLLEYKILRQVILEVLENAVGPLPIELRNIILDTIEEGVRKAVEQFVEFRSSELKKSNEDLEHFARLAAHDLKAPLASIIGFADILETEIDSAKPRLHESIRRISRTARRMLGLIDSLLDYACISTRSEFTKVSLSEILNEVLFNLKSEISTEGVQISVEELPSVLGEPYLITQIFQNLISNSIKYKGKNNPTISIASEDLGFQWKIILKDNGRGFDPNEKEAIFVLFKRLASSQCGSGIGLATVRKAVEAHGGKVWADSVPGKGSMFSFTLPKIHT